MDDINRFRKVAITVHDGKLCSRYSRTNMLPTIDAITEDTQFGGGLRGGDTAIAHLTLKASADPIIQSGKSAVFLFTDITGAFASLARQLVLPTGHGDEVFLRSLAAAGVDPAIIKPLYQDIKDTSLLGQQWGTRTQRWSCNEPPSQHVGRCGRSCWVHLNFAWSHCWHYLC